MLKRLKLWFYQFMAEADFDMYLRTGDIKYMHRWLKWIDKKHELTIVKMGDMQ